MKKRSACRNTHSGVCTRIGRLRTAGGVLCQTRHLPLSRAGNDGFRVADYAGIAYHDHPAWRGRLDCHRNRTATLHERENANEYSTRSGGVKRNNTDYDFSTGFCVAGADTADFPETGRDRFDTASTTNLSYWAAEMQITRTTLWFQSEATRTQQAGYRPNDTGQRLPRIHGVEAAATGRRTSTQTFTRFVTALSLERGNAKW